MVVVVVVEVVVVVQGPAEEIQVTALGNAGLLFTDNVLGWGRVRLYVDCLHSPLLSGGTGLPWTSDDQGYVTKKHLSIHNF